MEKYKIFKIFLLFYGNAEKAANLRVAAVDKPVDKSDNVL